MPKDPVEDYSGIGEIGAGEHLGPLTTVSIALISQPGIQNVGLCNKLEHLLF